MSEQSKDTPPVSEYEAPEITRLGSLDQLTAATGDTPNSVHDG